MGRTICAHRIWVGRPEEKKPLERHKCGWEDNIKIVLQDVGRGGVDGIDVAEDRDRWWVLVRAVMNRWVQ